MQEIPGSERCLGEGNGNPLQYSCLENTMDRGAWQAIVHRVERVRHDLATKPLSSSLVNWEKAYTLFFYFHCNELFFPVEYYTIAPILLCYKRI